MSLNLCRWGAHHYVTKASWTRCDRCLKRPPKLAPKVKQPRRDVTGWLGGPIR